MRNETADDLLPHQYHHYDHRTSPIDWNEYNINSNISLHGLNTMAKFITNAHTIRLSSIQCVLHTTHYNLLIFQINKYDACFWL